MMKQSYWAPAILGQWYNGASALLPLQSGIGAAPDRVRQYARAVYLSRLGAVVALVTAGSLMASAQSLGSLADRYREHPTPHNHVALMRFADAHSRTRPGALALFALSYLE